MKLSFSLLCGTLVALTAANPLVLDYSETFIQKHKENQLKSKADRILGRQSAGTTANEFLEGGCRDVIFIFARGSTQDGNIVSTTPPWPIPWIRVYGFIACTC